MDDGAETCLVKKPFPVGKRVIFRTMHNILLVICLLFLFTGPECS